MAVITFYTEGKEETGNTVSTVAYATYYSIVESYKSLLISTGLNDNTMDTSLWPTRKEKKSGLFGPNMNLLSQSGMEELNRIIQSNKLSPEMITNYTKVALRDRLELLSGYRGGDEQYKEAQKDYIKVIDLAKSAYDNVIVDLDKGLEMQTKKEILDISDVVIALCTQKFENFEKLFNSINDESGLLKKKNTIIVFGKYNNKTRYNAKNITRNFLKRSETIGIIPYNTLLFEAVQEGKIIDLFLDFRKLKIEDENSFFMNEMKKLKDTIHDKVMQIQMGM